VHRLTITAPAKVNLFLGIGAVRPDGHHDLKSIFQTLELHDTVHLTPADDLTLTCDEDLGIPAEHNLAFCAARAFSEVFEVDVLIDIAIEKRVPPGAGLAGGSSDAAAVLTGLAHWANLQLDDARLHRVARSLGADVPFFLYGGAALMHGRGDELVRHLPNVRFDVALIKPDVPVSTAAAYRAFDADPQPLGDLRGVADALRVGPDVVALGASLSNNMTTASVSLVPEVGEALEWMKAQDGVLGALVAGSGSSVFAVCGDAACAQRIAADAAARGLWSAATATRSTGVHVTDDEVAS
jgi:4-diphosphocytidyl-2-C-methyl-D-erythritol kinase